MNKSAERAVQGTPKPGVGSAAGAALARTPSSGGKGHWEVMPLAIQLGAGFEARWLAYCRQLRACQRKLSESSVHELRVATRRLLSAVGLLNCLGAVDDVKGLARTLKKRLKLLGPIRDTHVLRTDICRQMRRFPELVLLEKKLARQERRLLKAARPEVLRWKTGSLEKEIMRITRRLMRMAAQTNNQDEFRQAAWDKIQSTFDEVVRRREAILPEHIETLHRTRLAFKRFRYTVELLSPSVSGYGERRLKGLAQFQGKLGRIQDLEVLQKHVEEHWGMRKRPAATLQSRFLAHLGRRRNRLVHNFLTTADTLYDFWPPRRAGYRGQQSSGA